jgi:hypothetical protein
MVWCGQIKHNDEIQVDYLVAVLMHIFFAMHWLCIGYLSAYLVGCGDSETAGSWYSDVYLPALQEMQKMFLIGWNTFPTPRNIVVNM